MRVPLTAPSSRGWSMSRSRHQRKAARVLPVPVGARIRALSPRAITGQPRRCGAVGSSKTARNHSFVTGWKHEKGSDSETGLEGGRGTLSLTLYENSASDRERKGEEGAR